MDGLKGISLAIGAFRKLLFYTLITGLLLIVSNSDLYSQQTAGEASYENPSGLAKTSHHPTKSRLYAGAKVGLVYLFGLEMQYHVAIGGVNRLYLATALQSSFVVNSANAGGGIFLGQSGLGLGCRYHHLLWFDNEKDSNIEPGYGPEIIWNKKIGAKNLINLHGGLINSDGTFFPDISFGVLIPL